jgi:hypothetical protein
LGLIEFTDEDIGVQLVRGPGTEVADVCDRLQPGRTRFWQAVLDDRVSFEEVKALGDDLCPCRLHSFHEERDCLRRLLLGTPGQMDPPTRRRADSFRLLLSYLDQFRCDGDPWEPYRRAAYYRHEGSGKRFAAPADLEMMLTRWATYQAGEYVNRALEEIFLATLQTLQDGEKAVDTFAADFAREALTLSSKDLGLASSKKPWADRSVADLIAEARARQGLASEWQRANWSEDGLIDRAAQETDRQRKTALAFGCLLSVLVRDTFPREPYGSFETLAPDFKARHPVNLASVAGFVKDWQDKSASTVLAALVREKVLFRHLRVAMAKLRYQSQATFKFVVEQGNYIRVDKIDPTYTNPRLRAAFLFLRDLGLAKGRAGNWGLTGDGRALLRQRNGS